jgi:hypothetical protein
MSSTGICLGCADVSTLMLHEATGGLFCVACHPYFAGMAKEKGRGADTPNGR